MKKFVAGIITALVIIVLIIVITMSNLGFIIKRAINSYGPQVTKTKVHVDDVKVSLFSGQAEIKHFVLGNPQGFKSPNALKVSQIFLDIDKSSITKNPIVINKIEIVNPEISYEKTLNRDNFKTILNNIHSASSSKTSKQKTTSKAKSQRKLIIKDLLIKQAKLNFYTSLPGGKSQVINLVLPDIHLTNIGQDKGGVSVAEAAQKIAKAIYDQINSSQIKQLLQQKLNQLQNTVPTKSTIENIKNKALGILGK